MMAVLKPSQLQFVRNMSVKLIREPRDELDANSTTDPDANEDFYELPVRQLYRRKESIDKRLIKIMDLATCNSS